VCAGRIVEDHDAERLNRRLPMLLKTWRRVTGKLDVRDGVVGLPQDFEGSSQSHEAGGELDGEAAGAGAEEVEA
jgi:hypothetical protein